MEIEEDMKYDNYYIALQDGVHKLWSYSDTQSKVRMVKKALGIIPEKWTVEVIDKQ